MTPREHIEYMKMKLAIETAGGEASEIGRLANRMRLATEAFKEELERNSKGLDYDELHIEEGDNALQLNFGK